MDLCLSLPPKVGQKLNEIEQNKIKESIKANMMQKNRKFNPKKKKKNKQIPKQQQPPKDNKFQGYSFLKGKLSDKERFDNLLKLKKMHNEQMGEKAQDIGEAKKQSMFQHFKDKMNGKDINFEDLKSKIKQKQDL